MTRFARWTALSLVASALASVAPVIPVQAQNALLEVEKSDATKLLQVNDDGGLVVKGTEAGVIPATGTGARLMWYPAKAAFRAGAAVSNTWDDLNVGRTSAAMGAHTTASGEGSTALGIVSVASGRAATAMGDVARATGGASTAMGYTTTASGGSSTAMGDHTTASGNISTAMGSGTVASGPTATAMGASSKASGNESTAMGSHTSALGHYSTAMGSYAAAFGSGSFAYGDHSTTAVVTALNDQFVVRASGGFRFRTKSDLSTGCDLESFSGTFSCTSSRLAKEGFEAVDSEDVLQKLAGLSIQRWSYLGLATRHIGPVAEEFYAAFGLGEGPRTISTVDADGVSLLAIQALERRTGELRTENAALRGQLDSLRRAVARLSGF